MKRHFTTVRRTVRMLALLVFLTGYFPGREARAGTATLIASGDPAQVLVPTDSSLEAVWYTPAYAPDGNWTNGTTGVGYDAPGGGYLPMIGTDVGVQINGINGSFYMRQSFVLAATSGVSALTLRMRYDDGFVAYLNGVPVAASVTAPSPLAWNSFSLGNHPASVFEEYDLSAFLGELKVGTNLLAIQGLNRALSSSDLLILPELTAATTQNYFQVTSTIPANGAQLSSAPVQMTVNFDTPVNAATVAASDLKIDGIASSGCSVLDGDTVQFNLPGGLTTGEHDVTLAEGSMESATGDLLSAYAGTFSLITLSTITNLPATDISQDQAVLRARVTDTGGDYPVVFFAWGSEDGGTNAAAWATISASGTAGPDEFFAEPVALSLDTVYYYRALAVNGAGTNWASSTASFTTAPPTAPTIGLVWPSSIFASSARLNGVLSHTGGENPEVHIVWGDDNPGTNPGAWDQDVSLGLRGVSEFYTDLSGLETNTTYHFAVYADNSAGRTWKTGDPFITSEMSIAITEFMADNDTILTDGFGKTPDWIEIYNPLDSAQDLTGWYLTDRDDDLTKWPFPSKTIGAGEYLIVFASGSNTVDASGYLHTSFSLSSGGEYLALVRPDGVTILSEYDFPAQYPDISYGRSPDGTQIRYFETPTPGEANNTTYWDLVKDTKFSVNRGFYTNAFNVAITTATANATIRYTLDGSRPTETHGIVYSNPITISNTTVLRAFGYKSGFESSDVDAQTYIFIDDIVTQPSDPEGWPATFQYWKWDQQYLGVGHWETVTANWGMNSSKAYTYETELRAALTNGLTISLSTDMDVLFDPTTSLFGQPKPDIAMDHPVSVEIFDAADGETIQLNAAARMMGAVSGYPDKTKPNIRLLFKSEFVDPTSGDTFTGPGKLNYPLFEDTEVETFNTLVLRGLLQSGLVNAPDSAIQDAYIHRRFQAMGDYTNVHCRYVNVYLNGLYFGVFQAQERPDDSYMAEYFGGEREEYDIQGQGGEYIGSPESWAALQALLPYPAVTLSGATYQTIKDNYVDLERFADYMLLELFISNNDFPYKNIYFNCRRGSPAYGPPEMKWIPFTWDSDYTLRSWDLNKDLFVPFAAAFNAKSQIGRLWNNLYYNTAWRRLFGDRVHKHLFNSGELSVEKLNSGWLEMRDEMAKVVAGEICRWSTTTPSGWNSTVTQYTTAVFPGRYALCLQQLRDHGLYPNTDAPVYSRHGGVVPKNFSLTMTNPNGSGTIWYTTDDTDPRDSGTAVAYSGSPVTIQTTTRVKACVDSGSEWSAMNDAVFQVMPTLIVSEVMYNPVGTGPYAAEEYEFIELHNTGTASVDLSPVRLTKGVEFSFAGSAVTSLPAGAYVVVVRNPAAFASRYSTSGMLIAGAYTNSFLDNAGERITLCEKHNQKITSFIYDDAWLPATDGAGYSLVHLDSNPATDPNTADYWEVSPDYLGSPGAADQDVVVSHILVNEVLTHTDWPQVDAIELYNPTNVAVDLGGWWLTDSAATFKKFQIPSGTVIPAGGYLVIEEDNDGNTNTVPPAAYFGREFSLSSLGEEVYLSSPTRRWVHGFRFSASANGVSFGRHITGDGAEHFPPQISCTLGAANAGPLVGPLVFTEIMAHPPSGQPEYLEIRNISGAPVALYDAAHPSNTWLFTDGIGFVFPTGITLQAGGYILLSETNEAAFRAAWNANADVPVFGPYSGRLENAGEELELARPDTPNFDGSVPLIVGERAGYQTIAPWPAGAAGTGSALERIAEGMYADDPANWRASNAAGSPGDYPQVDLDADQLPDNWEMKHFGRLDHSLGGPEQDADGDGISNLREYILGTDPRVADDDLILRIISCNGAVELEFDSILPGQTGYYGLQRFYGIQQCAPRVPLLWEAVPGGTNIPATGAAVTLTNTPASSARWYRVQAVLE